MKCSPCVVVGASQLQLQLDFTSHLMRIGERLSHLPTKELRGMLSCRLVIVIIIAVAMPYLHRHRPTVHCNGKWQGCNNRLVSRTV